MVLEILAFQQVESGLRTFRGFPGGTIRGFLAKVTQVSESRF